VDGDPSQIHHALMNVCLNAIDAMEDVGTLTLRTSVERYDDVAELPYPDLAAGSYVRVEVADTGHGMDQGVADKAFEPFFTTKSGGEGAGLGLSMVYGTIANHGGAVVLESVPGEGTTVALLLPRVSSPSDSYRTSRVPRHASSEPGLATVLLVDDEPLIRKSTKRLLTKLGYKVLLAGDGREALRVFVDNQRQISAVMLDMVMPEMDGTETFHALREIDPAIPILLASGYSVEEQADALLAAGADGFVQKPFDLATLRSQLAALLA
jgi:CheY-like chemotaxis protein